MNTIADEWREFERLVVPATAGAGQRRDMRIAFYAGANAILALGQLISELSDDAAMAVLQSLHDESAAFMYARLAEAELGARPIIRARC